MIVELVLTLCAAAVGYLVGAVPVGVVVCRFVGRDPRTVGSGRTGATNVYRTAGWRAAILTAVGDVAKGFVPVVLAAWAAPRLGVPAAWPMVAAGLAATAGHVYPVYSGFRGGAGTAPNLGAVLGLDPLVFPLSVVVALGLLFGLRIASIASLGASVTVMVALIWRAVIGVQPPAYVVYAIAQMALVAWALRPNIARLRAGTERRVTFRWPSATDRS
jgi:acyl phosphate:glycerol-3-phosphate acyltransferase